VNVLAIGAHPDDVELGCGGTLALHRLAGDRVVVLVMTVGERGPQFQVTRMAEQQDACDLLGAELVWGGFPDCDVAAGSRAVGLIEQVMAEVRPDIVYTHAPDDSHQDHRAVAEASISACRRVSRLCFYEGPTTTGFEPTIYVDVSATLSVKIDSIRAHASQVLKNGLVDLEAIEALARCRGFQARIRNAEAFAAARFVWPIRATEGSTDPAGLLVGSDRGESAPAEERPGQAGAEDVTESGVLTPVSVGYHQEVYG
jgi:LmbE family N-acetylglucosaminyl deacetylase